MLAHRYSNMHTIRNIERRKAQFRRVVTLIPQVFRTRLRLSVSTSGAAYPRDTILQFYSNTVKKINKNEKVIIDE